MNGIKWIGPEVECYYDGNIRPGKYSFYKSFCYRGEEFEVGESVVVVKGKTRSRIGRLLCLYHSHDTQKSTQQLQAIVLWYTKAKNLDSKLNPTQIKFDKENEVIENNTEKDVVILLQNVVRKCKIVYCGIEDPVYFINSYKYDTKNYFSCRYKVESGRIAPRSKTKNYIVNEKEIKVSSSTRKFLAAELDFYSSDNETRNETVNCDSSILEPNFVFERNFSLRLALSIFYLLCIPVLFIILFIMMFSS